MCIRYTHSSVGQQYNEVVCDNSAASAMNARTTATINIKNEPSCVVPYSDITCMLLENILSRLPYIVILIVCTNDNGNDNGSYSYECHDNIWVSVIANDIDERF